ncbi:glycine decarboxylase H-protein [Fragilariopsis cylindrus CCMP1102]|uniref:Glycine cleavage system H protein n=1 Tax=Fragilariopsis cylindrus CCMP1102 TaxID=635003 RepID=A0A1E7EKB3_9STRA|nr:glycine decarboxylase H-protein [Fragilariopsis cylindrus CCMP1102]|eukprot:OEU06318.1 glycine decarboxylase H-protein [Fragilariopsis cylindrus CCMP1102]
MSSSRFALSLSRRVLGKTLRTKVASRHLGATRLSSYYTPAHEYVKVDGIIGTCGITDFAQAALGDIVFVSLPDVGDEFDAGDSFGSVESVKAASDVYAPVSGTVVEINEALNDSPELVNSSAEAEAWFIKIEMTDTSEAQKLMDETDYEKHCEDEA